MTVKQQAPSLTINRDLKAPIDVVYAAWTDPEKIVQWFAPSDTYTCEVPDFDLRVGGRYTVLMRDAKGERHCVSGEYREIVENEKLVFSWAWESTPERISMVTVLLRRAGDLTRLQLTHEQFADPDARDRHKLGWSGCLDRLVEKISRF
ncbi:MAG: SRPBCC family protein [Hyphomicrobiaceae bacterium]